MSEDVKVERVKKGIYWRSVPAMALAGVIAALVVGSIVAPVALSRVAIGQNEAARELIISAVPMMRACASREGNGSYAPCDAATMARTEPGIKWRDGLAPIGWGRGDVGVVYVTDLEKSRFRLETTSASGRVFKYGYKDGIVTRQVLGGGTGSW